MRRLLQSRLAALRLESVHRGLLHVIAEADRVVHACEDLARPAGSGDYQVTVVQETAEQLLLDTDRLHLAEQELHRVPRDDPDLEDEARRGDRELRREELDGVDSAPHEAAQD